jgi:hypothetical protein
MTDGFNPADRSCGTSPVTYDLKGESNEHLAAVLGTRYDEYVTQVTSMSQLMPSPKSCFFCQISIIGD